MNFKLNKQNTMKKLFLILMTVVLLQSCAIDRIDDVPLAGVNTFQTEYVTPTAEYPYGGYWIYFLTNDEITNQIFLSNGANGDGTVTICHKVTHIVTEHPEWGYNTNVTLILSLSDYIQHIYEYHNGNSTQNDSFGFCAN